MGPVGRWMHNRKLQTVRENGIHPHANWRQLDQVPVHSVGDLQIVPIPYLEDNLGYAAFAVTPESGVRQLVLLVDPGDFAMTIEVLTDWKIQGVPSTILTTHKHHDHAGNNDLFA